MSVTVQTSNITTAFIDLATYDALEQFMYGGQKAISYFVRYHTKATWFSHVPNRLSNIGTPSFGQQNWSASVSRAGDYLLYSWLRVTIPSVTISATNAAAGLRLRWTRNLMHNLIKDCLLNFNDITAAKVDNYFLDFWTAYTVPAGKRNGYNNMIGNVDDLINPLATGAPGAGVTLPSYTLNLPLPFFYSRDSGIALPTAALPYNDMKIQFNFRDWTELLIVDNIATGVSRAASQADVVAQPVLQNVEVWCDYAVVSNFERKQMGLKPRDILIEQVQLASQSQYDATKGLNSVQNFDIRFSHAIKALFFGLKNVTNSAEQSNYTAASPVPTPFGVNFFPARATDPIFSTAIKYENSVRQDLCSDYYSLIIPYYHAVTIPTETGYHLYSYALDLTAVDPMGSTNFSKLTNVSFQFTTAGNAYAGATVVGSYSAPNAATAPLGQGVTQQFAVIIVGLNSNIIRISGGALGGYCLKQGDAKEEMDLLLWENIVKSINELIFQIFLYFFVVYNSLVVYVASCYTYGETPYKSGNPLELFDTTSREKSLEGTRLIAEPNGNNSKRLGNPKVKILSLKKIWISSIDRTGVGHLLAYDTVRPLRKLRGVIVPHPLKDTLSYQKIFKLHHYLKILKH